MDSKGGGCWRVYLMLHAGLCVVEAWQGASGLQRAAWGPAGGPGEAGLAAGPGGAGPAGETDQHGPRFPPASLRAAGHCQAGSPRGTGDGECSQSIRERCTAQDTVGPRVGFGA